MRAMFWGLVLAVSVAGCADDPVQEYYDLLQEAEELACGCAVSEGTFAGTVAECRATRGFSLTQAQVDCVTIAYDDHASAADEAVTDCQIAMASTGLDCLSRFTCGQIAEPTFDSCSSDFESCGEVSAPLDAAVQACVR